MALVAGIDSSTQSCKVLIVDSGTRNIVRSGRAPHPEGTEVDPERWWEALQEAIGEAGGLDDVAAWAIAGQQHGMIPLDAEGRVVRPALLWNDGRSANAASELIREFGATKLAQRTGLVPVASFTVTKLRWLRDSEPAAASRVAAIALPHDWLTWRLRGFGPGSARGADLDELVTDRSDASGTGYWTVNGYDRELFVAALGRDAQRPTVLEPGDWRTDSAGRRVAPGMGDNAAGAFALGVGTEDLVVSIGTSGTVFGITESSGFDPTGAVAWFASGDGRFLPLVATLNAARVIEKTAALLGVSLNELSDLALESDPGAHGLVMIPYFEGERTPPLPNATASLEGMTLESTTRPNVARAAFEGMLRGLRVGVDEVQRLTNQRRRILLIGGGARSKAVREIAPQVFGIPVEVPEPAEYVALGAAFQAAEVL